MQLEVSWGSHRAHKSWQLSAFRPLEGGMDDSIAQSQFWKHEWPMKSMASGIPNVRQTDRIYGNFFFLQQKKYNLLCSYNTQILSQQ